MAKIRCKDEEADESRRGTGVPCPYNSERGSIVPRWGAAVLHPYMARLERYDYGALINGAQPRLAGRHEWLC